MEKISNPITRRPLQVSLVFRVIEGPETRMRYTEVGGVFLPQGTKDMATRPADAWRLRRKLWQEVRTDQDVLGFLNQSPLAWAGSMPVSPGDVLAVRQFTQKAVTLPPSEWGTICVKENLPQELVSETWALGNISLSGQRKSAHMLWVALTLREALLATVALDALRGSRYRLCKHCGNPFQMTSHKNRKFCSEGHRQLSCMARYRKRVRRRAIKQAQGIRRKKQ